MRFFLLVLLAAMPLSFALAQQTLPLYPEGRVPYNRYAKSQPDKVVVNADGRPDQVSGVTMPTLTVHGPSKPNGASVLVIPGGGYKYASVDKEGYKIAAWLNAQGYTAFVLRYRMPDSTLVSADGRSFAPISDATQAMLVIKDNAASLGLDTARIGVMGFSAGGHLAASLANLYDQHPLGTGRARPAFCVLVYPVITMGPGTHNDSKRRLLGPKPLTGLDSLFSLELQVRPTTPPTFIIHTEDDATVPVENAFLYAKALTAERVPYELHIFPKGGHGYNLAEGMAGTSEWPGLCLRWLSNLGR